MRRTPFSSPFLAEAGNLGSRNSSSNNLNLLAVNYDSRENKSLSPPTARVVDSNSNDFVAIELGQPSLLPRTRSYGNLDRSPLSPRFPSRTATPTGRLRGFTYTDGVDRGPSLPSALGGRRKPLTSRRCGWLVLVVLGIAGVLLIASQWAVISQWQMAESVVVPSIQYGLLIDAGSSGSRLYVYQWPEHSGRANDLLEITAAVGEDGEPLIMKVEPGLSSFAEEIQGAYESLQPLLDFAAENIPSTLHASTPLYILATAGLRLISHEAQQAIQDDIASKVLRDYEFLFNREKHIAIISGQMEGVFAWITTNYLLSRFKHGPDGSRPPTVGVVDMGGASTQISFEIPPDYPVADSEFEVYGENGKKSGVQKMLPHNNVVHIDLGCGVNDQHDTAHDHDHVGVHEYKVYAVTYLGYGANVARDRYIKSLVDDTNRWTLLDDHSLQRMRRANDTVSTSFSSMAKIMSGTINSPSSYSKDQPTDKTPLSTGVTASSATATAPLIFVTEDPCIPIGRTEDVKLPVQRNATYRLLGTGKFLECRKMLEPLLNITHECLEAAYCAFNDVYQPTIDYGNHEFWGLSEFWYTFEDIFSLGNKTYDHEEFDLKAVEFCKTPWSELEQRYRQGEWQGAQKKRLSTQCFKAAWVTAAFHMGHRFPKDYPLTPVRELHGVEVQWTLGAMLYYNRFQPAGRIQSMKALAASHSARMRQLLVPYPFLLVLTVAAFLTFIGLLLFRYVLSLRYRRSDGGIMQQVPKLDRMVRNGLRRLQLQSP